MTKAPISLQDLRRSLYVKAKAESTWRFWGLYVHVCKMETLREAYQMAKRNDGAPGIDGVTFEAIEESGVEIFLEQVRDELITHTYRPMRARKKEIPKDGGKVRVLSIPVIRDRVVQGALKLIREPIFEADFQPGSYGYRPRRTAHQAVDRVAQAIVKSKTRIIDIDLRAYFDNVQHHLLLEKVARRVQDDAVACSIMLSKCMTRFTSQPIGRVIELINPILRGWVNYFAVGHASHCFSFVRDWVEKKVRRHLMRAQKRTGFGWQRWSRQWLYNDLGLFNAYRVRRPAPKANPAGVVS